MAFDEGRVYWIDGQGIMSAPIDGSEKPKLIFQGFNQEYSFHVGDLAAGGGKLYWSEIGGIFTCPIASCAASLPTVVASGGGPLTLAGDMLYWIDGNILHACSLPDCLESLAIGPVFQSGVRGDMAYAVDANDIYWLEPAASGLARRVIRRTAK
jgi:hypothetical protein